MNRAIVLVDLDYVWTIASRAGGKYDPFALIDLIVTAGYSIVLAQSYADYQSSRYGEPFQRDQTTAGFRQVQCPAVYVGGTTRKSTVDPEIINDVSWALQNLEFDSLVLVAGDRDFIRAGQSAKHLGKEFCVIAYGADVSGDLRRSASQVLEMALPQAPEEERSREPLPTPAVAEPATPVPTAVEATPATNDTAILDDISRLLTLNASELQWMTGPNDEAHKRILVDLLDRVTGIMDRCRTEGKPCAFRHVHNLLMGSPSSSQVHLNGAVFTSEEAFRLLRLFTSHGVLVVDPAFEGRDITSYMANADHEIMKWYNEQGPIG